MKSIKFVIFLFLLLFISSAAFAADKPVWTVGYKKFNLSNFDPPYRTYEVQVAPDNKILINFIEHRSQNKLATKKTLDKSDTFFVVLLLSNKNGELIRRIEWPVTDDSVPTWRRGFDSRIYPLLSGGYVALINGHLQVLDLSFSVIYDRVLDALENSRYDIIVPLSGKYFILNRLYTQLKGSSEIIDSRTFETIERFDAPPDYRIVDIWEDQLLSISFSSDNSERRFSKRKINTSQWNDLELVQGERAEARFIYNGAIVVRDNIGRMPDIKTFWFIVEDGKKSEPVFSGLGLKFPSKASVVMTARSYLAGIRRAFDLFSKNWFEVYDFRNHKVLLETKKHTDIADHAISPDGDSIIIMTKKKIEFYSVNSKRIRS